MSDDRVIRYISFRGSPLLETFTFVSTTNYHHFSLIEHQHWSCQLAELGEKWCF